MGGKAEERTRIIASHEFKGAPFLRAVCHIFILESSCGYTVASKQLRCLDQQDLRDLKTLEPLVAPSQHSGPGWAMFRITRSVTCNKRC